MTTIAVCIVGAQAGAQAVDMQHSMRVGDTLRYAVSLNVLTLKEGADQTEMGRIAQTAHLTLHAARAEEDGSLIIEGRFDRLTTFWRRGDTQYEFTWTRPDADADAAPAAEPDNDKEEADTPASLFAAAHDALVKSPFELRVSSAGEILGVRGLAALGVVRMGKGDPAMLGMLRPRLFAEALGPIWDAAGAGAISKVGDTWKTERRVDLAPAGAILLLTRWSADSAGDGVLAASGIPEARVEAPDHPSPSQPTMEIVRSGGSAGLEWSLTDGRLISWDESLDLGVRWTIGDLKIGLSQRSKRSLRRLD